MGHGPQFGNQLISEKQRPVVHALSFGQQRLWFLAQLEPEGAFYNEPIAFRLRGSLNSDALKKSLQAIIDRHEVLRTIFSIKEGKPVQHIRSGVQVKLSQLDLEHIPVDRRETEVYRLIHEEVRRPFNLNQDLMLRACLLRVVEREHVIVLTIHHIAFDGWSRALLFKELTAFYRAFSLGQRPPISDLPAQYVDYARWQRKYFQGGVLERQLSFWKQQLDKVPPILALPTDRPRPPTQTYRGGREAIIINNELLGALKSLGQREGATLFIVLLTVLNTLLFRYIARTDIVVGSPTVGRDRIEEKGLIGLFTNVLALRTDLSGNPTFRELLTRVRATCLAAYDHQDMPFDMLVKELLPERLTNVHPLFQVEFELQNSTNNDLELPDLVVNPLEVHNGSSPFDLRLSLGESAEGLKGFIEYATDLFDRTSIQRYVDHFCKLLEEIVVDPDVCIKKLPLLTEAERRKVLVEWNDTKTDYYQDACLHEIFEAQVKRTPDAVAVVFEEKYLTYDQLNRQANKLAHCLIHYGVQPDTLVGLWVGRSMEMIVGVLGIHKAGAAYLPLEISFPQDRLAFMLEDAQVPVLLTNQKLGHQLPKHRAKIICLDKNNEELLDQYDVDNPTSNATVDNLAYVIYTSGSTGRPKGVLVEHKQVLNYVQGITDQLGLAPKASFAMVQPLAVDSCISVIFPSLLTGGCLHVITEERSIDPEAMGDYFSRHHIDCLKIAPSHLAALLTAPHPEQVLPHRWLIIGGEASRKDWAEQILVKAPELSLFNHYGPTEATVGMLTCPVEIENNGDSTKTLPLGRPLPNTETYVLDSYCQPVPIGVPGELYIGGDCLARGYLNRPDLCAGQFVPHPFSKDSGARLYRSGDLVCFRPDGKIEFLGRIDHQVKIRGNRIELGEIEAVLCEYPGVRETVVILRADEQKEQLLVAYVVGTGEQTVTDQKLRSFAKGKLPEPMIPVAFVWLPALPRTPHGKLDRRALPEPKMERPSAEDSYAPPGTEEEQVIAGIWTNILSLDRIGIHDNFFSSGGHSLLAVQLVSRIRDVFGVNLPPQSVFNFPTVARMTVAVVQAKRDSTAPPIMKRAEPMQGVPQRASSNSYLPSFAQERLWFLDQLHPDNSVYNVSRVFHLSGPLKVEALQRALDNVTARHETLRTTFESTEGRPIQVVSKTVSTNLMTTDVSELSTHERKITVQRLLMGEIKRSFDLSVGPLLRVSVIQLSTNEYILILVIHHIVSDGWSMGVLIRELSLCYEAYCRNESPVVSDLPVQYSDYVYWQREWLRGGVLEERLAYWKRQLATAPAVSDLKIDHPRPDKQTYDGAREAIFIDQVLVKGLKKTGQREDATLFMTLLAAFTVLLSRYTSQDEIIIGSPAAGRTHGEIEGLIGMFLNTMVLRTDLSGNPKFLELVRRVRGVCLNAYANQDVPFEKLVETLQPKRSLNTHPLFQISFVLQNTPREEMVLSNLGIEPMELNSELSQFDLTLDVREQIEGLKGSIIYKTDLFDRSTIKWMAECFHVLIEGIANQPDARLSEFHKKLDDIHKHRQTRKRMERKQASVDRLKKIRRRTIVQMNRGGGNA